LPTDTITVYVPNGAGAWGLCLGHNNYGDMGWAERYDINGADSSVTVLATAVWLTGSVNPASTTKNATSVVYEPANGQTDVPNNPIGTASLPYTSLTLSGSQPLTMFPMVPAPQTYKNFFVSFEIEAYTTSVDTFGVRMGKPGTRLASDTTYIGGMPNVRNAAKWNDGVWHDELTGNWGFQTHYCIFPYVLVDYSAVGIDKGVSKNGLTFLGNYPNPAVTSTNVKVNLSHATPVTIIVHDAAGKFISETDYGMQASGEHALPVDVSGLPTGNYFYVIQTDQARIGSQIQVVK
jgi:hypothetical protein